jgi:hypothetical protein
MNESSDSDVAKLIRSELVVNSDQVLKEAVGRAKRILVLDETGGVHFRFGKAMAGHRTLILVYLLGQKLAQWGRLSDVDTVDAQRLSKFAGASTAVVRARTSDLKSEGLIEAGSRGSWKLSEARISDVLSELEAACKLS